MGDLVGGALEMTEEEDTLRHEQGTLCGAASSGRQGNSAQDGKGNLAQRMNMPCDESNAVDIAMTSRPPVMRFMQSEQARLFMHSLGEDTGEERQTDSYIETGKLMHYALSRIGCAMEAAAVLDGLSNPTVAQWFAPGKRFLRECGIATRDPATGQAIVRRPDRVVMEPGLITVIDYKFGKRKDGYGQQVREYMRLVSSMYPHMEVRGWLWYVYSGQTERIFHDGGDPQQSIQLEDSAIWQEPST